MPKGKPMIFNPEKKIGDPQEAYLAPDYIPGYSEVVKARDVQAAEHLYDGEVHRGLSESQKRDLYKQIGAEPTEMPFEFKWVRVSSPSGGNSYEADRELMMYRHQGYEVVTVESKEDFVAKYPGCGFPPGAQLHADGTIRRLDVALAAIPREDARKLALQRKMDNAARLAEERASRHGPNTGIGVSVAVEETGSAEITTKPNV